MTPPSQQPSAVDFMAIEFECPVCSATIRVKDEAAGKKGRCPQCKTLLLVPEPEDEPPPEETPPEPVPAAAPMPPREVPAVAAAPRLDVSPAPAEPVLPIFPTAPVAAAPASPAGPVAASEPGPFPNPAPFSDSPFPNPASPFGIAAEPAPDVRPASPKRKVELPNAKILSAAAGVIGVGLVLLVGWYFYDSSAPDLSGTLTGERLRSVKLPPASFDVPAGVPEDAADRVMMKLTADELALKSEYVAVTLKGAGGRVAVSLAPGSQAAPVRVPLGDNPDVRAALKAERESIDEAKRKELEKASAELFTEYAAYLTDKKPLGRLAQHRDAVALNATTEAAGYAVEAVIAGHPFRCVAEDGDGGCYFFLPPKTKTFRLRGRKLPDGSTPLPVDFEVRVKEPPAETVEMEEERVGPDNSAEAGSPPSGSPPSESESSMPDPEDRPEGE